MKQDRIWVIALLGVVIFARSGTSQTPLFVDGQAEYARGQAALKIGNNVYAIQQFRRAVEINPDYVDAIKALAKTAKEVRRKLDPLVRPGDPF